MDDARVPVTWHEGRWLNPPPALDVDGGHVRVTVAQGSDFWRHTSYGFVRDSGHARLQPFPDGSAVEVSFLLDYEGRFDQAGLLVRADEAHWVKAGVEVSDGLPQVGAVVTDGSSDWSVAPVPAWAGQEVTVRASRSGDALTVRARCDGGWQLVRLAPIDPGLTWSAGPYCCAPERSGLVVTVTAVRTGAADTALHP